MSNTVSKVELYNQEINKIIITATSGLCAGGTFYKDKLTITKDTITVNYKSWTDEKNKWSHKTDSEKYKKLFLKLSGRIKDIILSPIDENLFLGLGLIEIQVVYVNDKIQKKVISKLSDDDILLIKEFIPSYEEMPFFLIDEEN